MSMKKMLLKAARSQKHKAEIERMSEADVAELLRTMNLSDKDKEEEK